MPFVTGAHPTAYSTTRNWATSPDAPALNATSYYPDAQTQQAADAQWGPTPHYTTAAAAAPAPDPYAQWGGQANFNNLRSGFNTQKANTLSSATDAARTAGIGLGSSISDLLDSLRAGQNKVDNQGVQAELSKRQGSSAVTASVGRGIKSSGVMLANKNASNSSAAGELAKAYGEIGRRELSGVNNQYAQDENAISQMQSDLDVQRASGARKIGESKQQVVNNIVSEAADKLAALDAQIASASLPDRINLEAEKNGIRSSALNELQKYDSQLNDGLGGIKASDIDTRRAEGYRMATAGAVADNPYDYSNVPPAQLQQTGPFASNMPLFTLRGRRQG